MKTIFAALLVLTTAFVAVRADEPAAQSAPAPNLSPSARKYAAKHEALLKKYAAKRRAMVAAPEWKNLSAQEQKARLDALSAEAKKRDARLTAAQESERRRDEARRAADQAAADQARRRQLNDVQTQAAQSAPRAP